jgi:YVTN family beta-propeller protein
MLKNFHNLTEPPFSENVLCTTMKTMEACRQFLLPNSLSVVFAGMLFLPLIQSVHAQVYGRATYSSPIAISQNDKLIFAVNPADDSVSVFRPDNNTRITTIAVGDEPQSVALTPDGQYAYVANAASNQ